MNTKLRALAPRAVRIAVILSLLSSSAAFAKSGPKISIADDPSYKEGTPGLVLIEVADFECPVCGTSAREVIPRIYDDFVKPGKVELIFLDFPLKMHPNAFRAAQAAACADEQGKYWDMNAVLFGNQDRLGEAQLPERAEDAGLDLPAFQKCLAGHKHDGAIQEDMRTGRDLGIQGTPGYVLGRRIEGGDKVQVLEVIHGLPSLEEMEGKIRALLPAEAAKQEAPPSPGPKVP